MVFERFKYNQRRRHNAETADQFIASLYGDRRPIQDSALSKRLQMDEKLTLEIFCAKAQQFEMISSQQSTVRQDEQTKSTDKGNQET